MNLTVKICKNHGELSINEVYKKKRINLNGLIIDYKCRYCERANSKKKRDDLRKKISPCTICKLHLPKSKFTDSQFESRYSRCKDCQLNENNRVYEIRKKENLKRKFGLTVDDYNNKLKEQNYVCEICKNPETVVHFRSLRPMRLSVDHNHNNGKIRGLLCLSCNQLIGHAKESKSRLQESINYLDKYIIIHGD